MAAPHAADPGPSPGPSRDVTAPPRATTIGRYVVEESIGTGGMGEVFRAYDPVLQRDVALKHCKLADPGRAQSLLREARLASQLKHPAVVSIFDVFEFAGEPVIVEEFIQGTPLGEHLSPGRPFALDAFLTVAEECASALAAADEQGIVHCDLKPGNILLDPQGHTHILDFGIARTLEPEAGDGGDVSEMLRFAGTPAYMAPERIRGRAPTASADIFSLGVVCYEMLTGAHPFREPTVSATIDCILTAPPPPPRSLNRAVPRELDRLVMSMLAKDPAARPASATQVAVALAALRRRRAGRRRRLVEGLGVACFIALLIYAVYELWPRPIPVPAGLELVVKEFTAQSAMTDDRFFAIGLSEAIEIRLAGLGGLNVYGQQAKVKPDLELAGSVQREGERVRIQYRLEDSTRRRTILGDVVEGFSHDSFALQDRVTDSIITALSQRYRLHQRAADRGRPTPDFTAYDHYLLGRGYMSRYESETNVEVAIRHFETALARDPQFALAMAGLGEAYWKRYEATHDTTWTRRAEAMALDAVARGPGLAEAHVTLGDVYRATGRTEAAAREFQQAIRLDTRSEPAYRGLAQVEEARGNFATAEATHRKAISIFPGYWAPHNQLGAFYYRQGRYAEARDAFTRVVELTPDNARGWANLGGMQAMLGQDLMAIASYEKSLAIEPNFAAFTNRASLLRKQRRFEAAASDYEKALAVDARHYEVWGDLGDVLSHIPGREAAGDSAVGRAIELARRELAVNPQDAALLSRLAQYEAFLGHRQEASRLAGRALEHGRGQPEVLWYVAGVYEGLGDRERALAAVRAALAAGFPAGAMRQEVDMAAVIADPRFAAIVSEAEAQRKK